MFELVFEGKLVAGVNPEDAKANMARLFKASPAQIERMFSGQRVVLRNKLDEDSALKYQVTLKNNGVLCELVPMTDAAPASAAPTPPPATSTAPAAAPQPSAQVAPVAPPAPSRPAYSPPAEGGERMIVGDRPKVAGEKTDDVLKNVDWTIAPTGVRMEQEKHVTPPSLPGVDKLSIAPVGVRMSDESKTPPPPPPDISHLSIRKD